MKLNFTPRFIYAESKLIEIEKEIISNARTSKPISPDLIAAYNQLLSEILSFKRPKVKPKQTA